MSARNNVTCGTLLQTVQLHGTGLLPESASKQAATGTLVDHCQVQLHDHAMTLAGTIMPRRSCELANICIDLFTGQALGSWLCIKAILFVWHVTAGATG